jgi:hypothetical protein
MMMSRGRKDTQKNGRKGLSPWNSRDALCPDPGFGVRE